MDPGRWSSDDMTDLEHELLEAARADRVPDALGARMAQGLGLGTATLSSSAAAAKLGTPLWAKSGLWGTLSLGIVAVTAGWHATHPAPAQPPTAAPAAIAQPAAEPQPEPAPAGVEPTGAPDMTGEAETEALGGDALRAEVALLARVRQALKQGATARALGLLARHHERFARGTLVPEAAALRIEALIQQGSHRQAATETERFVQAYPTHPLRVRVASLAQRAEPR